MSEILKAQEVTDIREHWYGGESCVDGKPHVVVRLVDSHEELRRKLGIAIEGLKLLSEQSGAKLIVAVNRDERFTKGSMEAFTRCANVAKEVLKKLVFPCGSTQEKT